MADLISESEETLEYARCVWNSLGATEIPRLAAAFSRRLNGGNRNVRYALSIEFPDGDDSGMLRPVATSRISEAGEKRLLQPVPLNGQYSLPLSDEET